MEHLQAYSHQQFSSPKQRQNGMTLIELLVAVVILGVVLSFALPAYQGYVETSQEGVVRGNIDNIEIFQEDVFLRTGAYANDLADIDAIDAAIGWEPRNNDGITYSIDPSDGTFYEVTAVHPDGLTVCVRYPDRIACP
ncbi:MAG: prepilin-type N-terminal cleavage/methylation domain-containing protein [Pseudomonadaceae bacterium]|nr:prepilin-type N-terminal cleavage/methylation domain-containing protein [Pseudomonadaceae bacterium]